MAAEAGVDGAHNGQQYEGFPVDEASGWRVQEAAVEHEDEGGGDQAHGCGTQSAEHVADPGAFVEILNEAGNEQDDDQ